MSVQTVLGAIDLEQLGIVLSHEHLVNDLRGAYSPAGDERIRTVLQEPVSPRIAWALADHPYNSLDNCRLDDLDGMTDELKTFRRLGGGSVIDLPPRGLGRRPEALARLSRDSGVNIIMGSGWYLERFQTESERASTVETLMAALLEDFRRDGPRPGVIGEIGVSPMFTAAERATLRAAAMCQSELRVPLFVHTPAWARLGHEILDLVVDECGVSPQAVALCHMDPSHSDPAYQRSLAERGAMLGFDMIGMPFTFPSEGACPGPEQSADAIMKLAEAGFAKQALLSHDLFLKSMMSKHGGNGLCYVPFAFPARLYERGLGTEEVHAMIAENAADLFMNAANYQGALSTHGKSPGCRRELDDDVHPRQRRR